MSTTLATSPTPNISVGSTGNEAHETSKMEATQAPKQEQQQYLTGFYLYFVMAALIIIMFLALLDISVISTAIPVITQEFQSVRHIGWYGSGYQLASACMQPLAGKLYTFYPSKLVFLAFLVVFEVGSVVCGTASSSAILIIGRAIAGLGAAGIIGGSNIIMAAIVPLQKFPAFAGVGLGISQLGLVGGPLLGGLLTEKGARPISLKDHVGFLVTVPVGIAVAAPLIFLRVPDQFSKSERPSFVVFIARKMDIVGFLFLAPAATMVLLGLHFGGNEYPWNSAAIILMFVGASVLFALFCMFEGHKGADALLPLNILCKRVVWCSCLVMSFSMATNVCTSYFLPVYFQAVKQVKPIDSGVNLMPNIVSQLLGGIISGLLVSKFGYYLPLAVVAGMLLTVGSGLISTYGPNTGLSKWIGYQTILGLGRGLGMQTPIIALQSFLPAQELAIGTAIIMFGYTMGAAIFLSIGQSIFVNGLRSLIPLYAPDVDPEIMINGGVVRSARGRGAGEVTTRPPGELRGICEAINRVFYMTTCAGAASFLFAWGMGWKSVKKHEGKDDVEKRAETSNETTTAAAAAEGGSN